MQCGRCKCTSTRATCGCINVVSQPHASNLPTPARPLTGQCPTSPLALVTIMDVFSMNPALPMRTLDRASSHVCVAQSLLQRRGSYCGSMSWCLTRTDSYGSGGSPAHPGEHAVRVTGRIMFAFSGRGVAISPCLATSHSRLTVCLGAAATTAACT